MDREADPIQLDFTLYRMAEQATADPSLAGQQPYTAALAKDYHWLGTAGSRFRRPGQW